MLVNILCALLVNSIIINTILERHGTKHNLSRIIGQLLFVATAVALTQDIRLSTSAEPETEYFVLSMLSLATVFLILFLIFSVSSLPFLFVLRFMRKGLGQKQVRTVSTFLLGVGTGCLTLALYFAYTFSII